MGKKQQKRSLRSKAVHLVSDFTTVLLNPISDKTSKTTRPPPEEDSESKRCQQQSAPEEYYQDKIDEPDTSSFTAFLYSLLLSSETEDKSKHDQKNETQVDIVGPSSDSSLKESSMKETGGKKSLLSRGKQSIGKAFYQAARIGGYRSQTLERKSNSDINTATGKGSKGIESEGIPMQTLNESVSSFKLPEMSEPSLLLADKVRNAVYIALPSLVQGRKWVLLYSTWRHGISLTTLYRRSMLWPGLSLLVVGDHKGAVFGGLVEAPLRPTSKRYQGTSSTFVFTNMPEQPVIFRPTGINRYFTLCSPEFLALGGGGHFALYLDGDLLNGSSSASETYGNPCLAHSEDFQVKEIELWGFVYDSKYDETVSLLRTEAPGICRW